MKYIIAFITGIIFVTSASAAPEDFIGTFKGTDKTTVTNCANYNGTTTNIWSVKYSDVKGTALEGTGSNAYGDFTISITVTDLNATGTIKGVNKWHQYWIGETKGSLDGDKYTATITGTVSTGCKFTSEIEATRN